MSRSRKDWSSKLDDALWSYCTAYKTSIVTGEKKKFQLQKLEELWLDAIENSRTYKERTKIWHDKHILCREFQVGELVLLFNSRWPGPFRVTKVYPYGTVEIWNEERGLFNVNDQHLKHYLADERLEKQTNITLLDPT
ncbi:PREDICTED: uncharacterized protein LOC109329219 [Lupinus angustifolius]|uniref:uncharacterized protein LOC109329219 n=1 Tax=Lupinus angustifolius TaxID=3871 RepID=UPI00092F8825|nr:PREDICTED: uncharacterized protein LOC109329219 [Lupinus angustifolius]